MERKNKLERGDLQRRTAFCNWFIGHRRFLTFLIGDEAQFLLDGAVSTQNVRCYAPKGNPPDFSYRRNKNDKRSVRVWAGIIEDHIIGPFVYHGNMDSQLYTRMLTNEVIPALQQLGYSQARRGGVHFPGLYLIQDGAPCHMSRHTRAFLETFFPGKEVRRFNPIEWPP